MLTSLFAAALTLAALAGTALTPTATTEARHPAEVRDEFRCAMNMIRALLVVQPGP
jgi:hypothetical protein